MPNEHGSQVEVQGLRRCYHNKHKKFPYRPTRDVSLLSGHASYLETEVTGRWRKPHNKEFGKFYFPSNLISVIKSTMAK
jgi:hypothetical protein